MYHEKNILALGLVLMFCTNLPPPALSQAQESQASQENRSTVLAQAQRFQYAVKFICLANIPGTSSTSSAVLPGSYLTVVNVHNPGSRPVFLRKKIAFPGSGEEAGPRSKWIEHKLAEDGVFSLECGQLLKDFGITPIHGAEGFLVIESTGSLDVTAVYTAGHRDVESIAVEQIRERIVR